MTGKGPVPDLRSRARRHRAALDNVVFIAVTGSRGKTTTKDLITSILGRHYPVTASSGSDNCGDDVARDLLMARPEDRFYVQELGAWGPGTLEPGIALVRPQVAVVTNVGDDHYSAFRGPDGAAAEKGKLVASLPPKGVAVLNWDDRHVRAMAETTRARVLFFGRAPQVDLQATDVTSRWPESLAFTARHAHEQVRVRTRLLGAHLVGSALAAMTVGMVSGLSLAEAAAAVEAAAPTPRRMTSVTIPDGVTFVRDDFKAPAESVPEVLAFMAEASAARKIAVFGHISDHRGRSRGAYTEVARQAIAVVDAVIFVGDRAADLWGEDADGAASPRGLQRIGVDVEDGADGHATPIHILRSVARAGDFLDNYLRRGDLVLLKASGPTDHLERILLRRMRPVTCEQRRCRRVISCDACDLLDRPLDGVATAEVR